jgi:hypothetical protein
MSSATILFCDIVSFSKKATDVQKSLVESLTSEILYAIRKLLIRPFKETETIALPTGDGVAIAYLHSEAQSWEPSTILELCCRLHYWAYNTSSPESTVKLRIGIHVGSVDFVVDINNNTNICGDSINIAQRVMDAANPMQTLFSDSAYRYYFGSEPVTRPIKVNGKDYKVSGSKQIETYAKHGLKLIVHSLQLDNDESWYNGDDPFSKNLMLLTTTPLPKEIVGDFTERLTVANEIAFIQLTGNRLLEKLQKKEIILSTELQKFWVVMPDPKSFNEEYFKTIIVGDRNVAEMINQWEIYLEKYSKENQFTDVRLITFIEPAFLGASFINWSQPGGRIHVSPYIWNKKATECPGYDIEWLGIEQPGIYKAYLDGLNYLCKSGERLI